MRGREFIDVASWLKGLDSEASVRSQTSRLYYAAYLEARAWCEDHLGYTRNRYSREHADVVRLINAQETDLADDLAFLRGYRNTADYDMNLSLETVALQSVDAQRRARRIIARLDELADPGPDA